MIALPLWKFIVFALVAITWGMTTSRMIEAWLSNHDKNSAWDYIWQLIILAWFFLLAYANYH